jgi:hypothetical protein
MRERYQYIHDLEGKKVFRFPIEPQVMPQPVRRSKKVYHYVRMQVDIVRADNVLTGNQWKYPTSDYPSFTYDDRYSAADAAEYFMQNYAPRGQQIDREEFERLSSLYAPR